MQSWEAMSSLLSDMGLSFDVIPSSHLEGDRDKRIRPELAQNIVAPKGQFTKRLFVGHNTIPQGWRVKVRDVASGTVRECVLSGSDGI